MKQLALVLFTLLTLGARAQSRSYDQMEVDYNRFKNEGKKDSILLVAREMNEWALRNEGDSSLRYAVSFRYIGNGHLSQDSSLFYYKKSLLFLEKINRNNSLEYAYALYNIGKILELRMDNSQALEIFLKCHQIFVDNNELINDVFINCTQAIAEQLFSLGIYLESETFYIESINGLIQIGKVYSESENASKSEFYLYQAKALIEKIKRENKPEYALCIFLLAQLYHRMGDYEYAEEYYNNAIANTRILFGDYDKIYGARLCVLASMYEEMKDYEKAIFFYVLSSEITKINSGEKSLEYAELISHIGLINWIFNDYEKADFYMSRATGILRDVHGPFHLSYASSLFDLGSLCVEMGQYQRAVENYEQAMEIRRIFLAEDDPEIVECINNLGWAHYAMNQYHLAESAWVKTLQIYKRNFGEIHPICADNYKKLGDLYFDIHDYFRSDSCYVRSIEILLKLPNINQADSSASLKKIGGMCAAINDCEKSEMYLRQLLTQYRRLLCEGMEAVAYELVELGDVFMRNGQYALAELVYSESREIIKDVFGFNHSALASCLDNLGVLYMEVGQFEMSLSSLQEAIEIWRENLGEDSSDYIMSIGNLGMYYYRVEDFASAKNVFETVSSYFRSKHGIHDLYYAQTISNLALVYLALGDYSKAERLNLESLIIKRDKLGCDDLEYITELNNLGLVYIRLGHYDKAEYYFVEVLRIRQSISSELSSEYALCLMNLGVLNLFQGQYARSEGYLMKSLKIIENASDTNYLKKSLIFQSIGSLYIETGLYDRAEYYYLKSLNSIEEYLGDSCLSYANCLNSLGVLFLSSSDYIKAKYYFDRALSIYEKNIVEQYSNYALTLSNLGVVYLRLKDYSISESFFLKAKKVSESNGTRNIDYCVRLINLGWVYIYLNDYTKAKEYFVKSQELLNEVTSFPGQYQLKANVGCAILSLQERDMVKFHETLSFVFKLIRTLMQENAYLNSKVKLSFKNEFELLLFPIISLAATETNDSISQLESFNQWIFFNGWVSYREEMLSREIKPLGDSALAKLYDDYNDQRLMLSNYYQLTNEEISRRELDIERKEEEVGFLESLLAEKMQSFKRINSTYNFKDILGQLKIDEAYVDIIRAPYYDFKNLTWPDSSYYVAYVVTSDTKEYPTLINLGGAKRIDEEIFPYMHRQIAINQSSAMNGAVFEYLWKPLKGALEGKGHIYISCGGVYHNLNLETLYNADSGKFLFEEKDIHLVSSGRSFVDQRLYGSRDYKEKTAVLIGSPDYDSCDSAREEEFSNSAGITYATMRDLTLDGSLRVELLPSTLVEIESISSSLSSTHWSVQLYTGAKASEYQIKQMASPRILHIATHGFFLENVENSYEMSSRMLGIEDQRVLENPLLRSGLLLSGCNMTFAKAKGLTDNGILTAYEAGLLDLSKTELVVLSACETGKGEILNGEGVQGLRKAMTDAGAEHILMSLWKVDDKVTSEYMQTFYGHYARGKSIRESYNLTRNEIKQKYPQPYYWGAFVLVGD
jgi:tetratricopeptide (TPR) repeat protein